MSHPLKDDRDLSREQVQQLSSGQAMAEMFAYPVGYPVEETRLPMMAEVLALKVDLDRATRCVERQNSRIYRGMEDDRPQQLGVLDEKASL